MAVLGGHQQVVYQLATSHETLAKKILVIRSSIAICEREFSKQMLPRASLQLATLDALI